MRSELTEAEDFMARAERAFRRGDMDAVIELFDEDVVVTFADFPPMRGKAAYRDFLEARRRRQIDYRPTTTVRAVMDDVIGSSWEATWVDGPTGRPMQGRGCEFVRVAGGLIVEFVASFNAWEAGGEPMTPII